MVVMLALAAANLAFAPRQVALRVQVAGRSVDRVSRDLVFVDRRGSGESNPLWCAVPSTAQFAKQGLAVITAYARPMARADGGHAAAAQRGPKHVPEHGRRRRREPARL